jgi:hypothetical protein
VHVCSGIYRHRAWILECRYIVLGIGSIISSFSGAELLIVSVPAYPIMEILSTWFQLIIGTVFPFFIILISNVIIIITVKRASEERNKIGQGKGKQTDTRFLTRMLIFVSVAYVVTSMPYRLYYLIYSNVPWINRQYNMKDEYWFIRYNVQVAFVFQFWCLNYAVNFYLYCIGGGQRYRQDTLEVCKAMFCLKTETRSKDGKSTMSTASTGL